MNLELFINVLAAVCLLILAGSILYPMYLFYVKNIREAEAYVISYRVRVVFAIGIFFVGSYLIVTNKYSNNKVTPFVAAFLLIRKWHKQ